MLTTRTFTSLVFLFCLQLSIFAQRDTSFWFAAPEVSSGIGESPVFLRFQTYDQSAAISVSQPANGAFIPLTLSIPSFSTDSINLTAFLTSIESPAANIVSNNGLKISSTGLLSVSYDINSSGNKEHFSLKGGKALGTNFYTPFQKFWATSTTTPSSYSGFEIVASQNATTVLITPRTAITGHAANVTYSISLNAGQTYSARDMNATAASSLAGSIVSSNKPVAITLFDGQLTEGACSDMIGDQLVPTPSLGTDYAIYKGISTVDRIYVLATQNSTAITVSGIGTTSTLINVGETYEIPMTEDLLHINTSKPVYVYHVSGFQCELSAAIVPSLNCKGNNNAAFSRSNSDSLGITLVTRTGFEGNFLLNGSSSLITSGMFVNVPGTSGQYKAARIFFTTAQVPPNSHNMIVNTTDIFTMGVMTGGTMNAGSTYAYITDFSASAASNAGVNDTVCANVDYTLNGSVGGGAITGNWSSNGFGTFQNGINSIPNVYIPSPLDTLISPIRLILSTSGSCPVDKDTLLLTVTPEPIVNANVNQTICANNATIDLNGLVSGGASSGYWSSNGTGVFLPDSSQLNASYLPSSNDISSGALTFVLTSNNSLSCATVNDTMEVMFTAEPVVTISLDTITVCANNSTVNLSGTVTGPTTTGKWTSSGTGIFSPNNSSLTCTYLPSAADTTNGFVWIHLESTSNGNCLPNFDSVYVAITNAPIVNAGVNLLSCTNDAVVQLNASITGGAFGGLWSGGNGFYTPSTTTLNASYTPTAAEITSGSIVLTLTATNIGTCNSVSDIIQINFVAPPFANYSATSVCEGLTTQFTDFSLPGQGIISSYLFDFGGGQTTSNQNPSYQFSGAGSYPTSLIVTNSFGCSDTTSVNVLVHAKPLADFNYTSDCSNNTATLSFTDASTSTSTINYWFYDFDGQGSAALEDVNQQFASAGSFDITHIVTTLNGCSDTIVKVVVIDPLPEAGFYYNSNGGLNVGAIFNFIDTSEYSITYDWDFGDGGNSIDQNPTHTYFANGNYTVIQTVTNALGCIDSAIRFISINTVTNEITTLIPTIISPNGDGINDVWKLDFIQLLYPNAHVEIFNEWGQQLFVSNGYGIPWDGRYDYEPVPDGNYMYVIELNADSNEEVYKGVLMVLRKR